MNREQEYKTLLCLTALCLPKTTWAANYLRALGHAFHLPPTSIDGAVTLTYSGKETTDSMLDRAESMATSLRSTLSKEAAVKGLVMILLLTLRGKELAALSEKKLSKEEANLYAFLRFDARTSVVLRRLALLLRVKLSAVAALEEIALREMQKESAMIAAAKEQENKAETKSSWMRHAKIGAAATAAGGLLFVTGGLAAPALATGLASVGLAGAATFATTTTCATLLGTAGAGLGAYKMSRRTKGLTTFEFQRINTDKDEEEMKGMTVYICVSGNLRQPGPSETTAGGKVAAHSPDFYGPWGAQPPHMFPMQTLDQFYAVVASEKRPIVPLLLKHYAGREDELMDKLANLYNVHPKSLKPDLSQKSHFLIGDMVGVYEQVLYDGMVNIKKSIAQAKDGEASGQPELSKDAINLFLDDDYPWDDAIQTPTLQRMQHSERLPTTEDQGAITTKEDMEQVMTEMDAKMKMDSKDKGVDKEILSVYQEEVELLDLEDTIPVDRLTVDDGKATGSIAKILVQNEVYWWRETIANYGDQYSLVWDPEKLLDIGRCVENLIREGVEKGIKKSLQYTALSAVLSAVAMPLTITSLIGSLDESWTMAGEAADEAGKLLADALMSESHGNRPVVLVGYSVGGRVVAKCLTELAVIATGANKKSSKEGKTYSDDDYEFLSQSIENDASLSKEERKRRLRAATIVRDAVIIGAPCDTAAAKWSQRRSVVLGRLINVHCPSDWVLSMLYRYKRWSVLPLAGLREVKLPQSDRNEDSPVSPIENFDVSDIVDSHGDYPAKMKEILRRVAIGDVDCEESHPKYFLSAHGIDSNP